MNNTQDFAQYPATYAVASQMGARPDTDYDKYSFGLIAQRYGPRTMATVEEYCATARTLGLDFELAQGDEMPLTPPRAVSVVLDRLYEPNNPAPDQWQ